MNTICRREFLCRRDLRGDLAASRRAAGGARGEWACDIGRQVGYWAKPDQNLGMSVVELQAIVIPRLGQVVDGDSNAALAVLAAMALGIYHQQHTGEGQKATPIDESDFNAIG